MVTKTSLMRVHLLGRALTIIDMRNRAAREKRHFGKFFVYNPARRGFVIPFWIYTKSTFQIRLPTNDLIYPAK
jgi:hypothetical protein